MVVKKLPSENKKRAEEEIQFFLFFFRIYIKRDLVCVVLLNKTNILL